MGWQEVGRDCVGEVKGEVKFVNGGCGDLDNRCTDEMGGLYPLRKSGLVICFAHSRFSKLIFQ